MLHLLVVSEHNVVTQITFERKIPLVTIKSIGMSNLRDNWLAWFMPLSVMLSNDVLGYQ